MDLVLERMRALQAAHVVQTVYIVDPPSQSLANFADAIRNIGIELRRPASGDGTHTVLVEVHRPDGTILSGLAGEVAPFVAAHAPAAQLIPLRSPRLGRLVLELAARGGRDVRDIVQALEARTLPLMLIVDPKTRGVAQRAFGNQVALPTFSDLPCLHRAASEMGMPAGSYGVAMFEARALFAMAEAQRVVVAICAYRDNVPVYAVVPSLKL